jgi:hypothetical protein
VNLPVVASARLPETYERAKLAIEACSRIDECAEWANKAEALASYAKQSKDDALRRHADRIQARAIRKCGELLRQIEKGAGRPPKNGAAEGPNISPRGRKAAAHDAGLSPRQAKTALRVANVPGALFEDLVEDDEPPTVTQLAERGKRAKPKPIFDLKGRDPKEFRTRPTPSRGRSRRSV